MPERHPFPVCNILGVNIAVTNMEKTVSYLCSHLSELSGSYVCVSNVHTTVTAYEDESYRAVQNGAALALPDGKPLSLTSRKRGFAEAERVTGPDLMGEIFRFRPYTAGAIIFMEAQKRRFGRFGWNWKRTIRDPDCRHVFTAFSAPDSAGGQAGHREDQ